MSKIFIRSIKIILMILAIGALVGVLGFSYLALT